MATHLEGSEKEEGMFDTTV